MSKWREKYEVHPAADVFPMMSDAELDELGKDILEHGLKEPITVDKAGIVLDGRNRFEAMERVGIDTTTKDGFCKDLRSTILRNVHPDNPVAYILSKNVHRRHLTQAERADAIVRIAKATLAQEEKPGQVGPVSDQEEKPSQPETVSKGGRGKRDPLKAKAMEVNAALPKEQQASERTLKRSIAKAKGNKPKPRPEPKRITARPMPKPKSSKGEVGISAVQQHFIDLFAQLDRAEMAAVFDTMVMAMKEAMGKSLSHQSPQ